MPAFCSAFSISAGFGGHPLMGIASFWVSNGLDYPEGMPKPSASGSLDDLIPWLDKLPSEELAPDFSSSSAITATMRGIPAAIRVLTQDPALEWMRKSDPNEWSLVEITCHLRDVEMEVNLPRLKQIQIEERAFIPGVDSDAWAEERGYQTQDGLAALKEFIDVRKETLALLDELTEDDWEKDVQHAIFGPTNLREIAGIMSRHDRLHLRQAYDLCV